MAEKDGLYSSAVSSGMTKARHLLDAGEAILQKGDLQEATRIFSRARDVLGDSAKELVLRRQAVRFLMKCYNWICNYDAVFSYYREFKHLMSQCDDPNEILDFHKILGNMWWKMGMHHIALDEYGKGIQLAEEMGDIPNIGAMLIGKGSVESELGLFEEAHASLSKAMEILDAHRDRWSDGFNRRIAYNNTALNHEYAGRYNEAVEGYQKTLDLTGEERYTTEERTHINLARVLVVLRRFKEAEEHIRIAEDMNKTSESVELQGGIYLVKALQGVYSGKLEEGEHFYKKAQENLHNISSVLQGFVSFIWGRALHEMGHLEEAGQSLRSAQEYFLDMGNDVLGKRAEELIEQAA